MVQKLPNGVNFRVKNDSSKAEQVIHHDRLTPVRVIEEEHPPAKNLVLPSPSKDIAQLPQNDPSDSDSDDSDESENNSASSDEPVVEPRYPRRVRVQRRIENTIPWDAVNL